MKMELQAILEVLEEKENKTEDKIDDLDEYFDDKWEEWSFQRELENEEYWGSRF